MAMEYGTGGSFSVKMDGPFAGRGSAGGNVKMTTISAPQANWKGGESPYSMAVGVDVVTVSSKVDVQLSMEQMVLLKDQIITFMAENNGGNVTLYAFGDKPKADIMLQATVTEMAGEGVILGNGASTVPLRSDYGQTDPSKSDFILNKPDQAIQKAQSTADSAKTTAEAALPKAGGNMTGAMTVLWPVEDTNPATKKYVDTVVANTYMTTEVTLTADGWQGEGPYTQIVAVEGILATDRPHYGVVYSAAWEAEKEAFAVVDDLDTAENSLTFICYEEKPDADLTIQLEVNR